MFFDLLKIILQLLQQVNLLSCDKCYNNIQEPYSEKQGGSTGLIRALHFLDKWV
jgi:hypothetical protein